MRKVFIDTNVLLDLLLEREPWAKDAAVLFSMADRKEVEILCCSLSFSTAIYLMQRFKYTRSEIVAKLSVVKSICTITTVNEAVIDRMLQSEFGDLEDAIQYYSALSFGAEAIITRNVADYSPSRIPVFTPKDFVK
jgi:predicted nucleic acid-binding protein